MNLQYKDLIIFCSGGKTTDRSLQLSLILQKMPSGWWYTALLENKHVVYIAGHEYHRRANLKSLSVIDILLIVSYDSANKQKQYKSHHAKK